MEFDDPVYGSQKVEEEVLQDLINSGPVQRLKHVHQGGPSPFFADRAETKRFEHSLGVMFLLREFNASIEEQIAGLLHDVPHTAFSHVADFVFKNSEHEYHDNFFEEVVMDSKIPEILEEHGLDVDYILDESNFRLLERDAPDLCADRIDYFLRDALKAGKLGESEVEKLLNSLTVKDNRFVLKDKETAELYALKYVEADEKVWASPEEAGIYEVFASVLKRAMEIGLIEEEDLFGTDKEIMDLLERSGDPEIEERLELLCGDFRIERNKEDYDFKVKTKARFVDPQVVEEDMRRVSEVSEKVRERIEEHKKDVQSGYCLKITG